MPSLYTYYLFISHSWAYHQDYYNLVRMLASAQNFRYRNYSVPSHDGFDEDDDEVLAQALRNQMRPAQVFIIIAGMYAHHRRWIQFEIAYAQRNDKPMVIIRPWGQERVPVQLQDIAGATWTNWNTNSIVSAIRTAAR